MMLQFSLPTRDIWGEFINIDVFRMNGVFDFLKDDNNCLKCDTFRTIWFENVV